MKELAEQRADHPAPVEHAVAQQLQELMMLFGAASEGAWLRAIYRAGLTAPQTISLHVLAREGATTVSALADRLHLTRGTVSHLVERLVQLRLVTRQEEAGDRRQKRIELAPSGTRLLRQLHGERQADFARGISLLTAETRAALEKAVGSALAEMRARLDGGRK